MDNKDTNNLNEEFDVSDEMKNENNMVRNPSDNATGGSDSSLDNDSIGKSGQDGGIEEGGKGKKNKKGKKQKAQKQSKIKRSFLSRGM